MPYFCKLGGMNPHTYRKGNVFTVSQVQINFSGPFIIVIAYYLHHLVVPVEIWASLYQCQQVYNILIYQPAKHYGGITDLESWDTCSAWRLQFFFLLCFFFSFLKYKYIYVYVYIYPQFCSQFWKPIYFSIPHYTTMLP